VMRNETVAPAKLDSVMPAQNTDPETVNDHWDAELTPLVRENADVIVRCPWQDDAEMTLSAAINSIQIQISRENVDQVVAEVYLMLANRVVEQAEESEDLLDEAEEKAKTESTKAKDLPAKHGNDKSKEKPAPEAKKITAGFDAQTITETQKVEATQVIEVRTEQKAEPAEQTNLESALNIEAQTTILKVEPDPANNIDSAKTETELIPDTTNLLAHEDEVHENTAANDENAYQYYTAETDAKPEITFEQETETLPNANDETKVETMTEELVSAAMDADDSQKTEAQTNVNTEPYTAYDEAIEEVAETENEFSLITPELEFSRPEVLTEASEILNKITELPSNLELGQVDQEETQEQLEELFAELFEVQNIEHSPEQVEQFARALLNQNHGVESESVIYKEDEESATTTAHDSIVKQVTSLKHLIISLPSAYAVGKSILKMCRVKKIQVAPQQ
jgi:hypothetical protein